MAEYDIKPAEKAEPVKTIEAAGTTAPKTETERRAEGVRS